MGESRDDASDQQVSGVVFVWSSSDETIATVDPEGRVRPDLLDPLIFMYNFGHPGEYWSLGRKVGERRS